MEKNLYRRITNPLDEELFIKEMLYNYVYSDNMEKSIMGNMIPKNRDYSMIFHDLLFKNNYCDWKDKIGKLYVSLSKDDINYNEIKTLYDYISKYSVKNYKDVNNVLKKGYLDLPKLFNKYCDLGMKHNYNYINTYDRDKKLEHCLVFNCDIKKMYLLLYKFYEKCKNNNLDYCIYFDETGDSKLSIKIYSDTDNLDTHLNIIKEIIDENGLVNDLETLPLIVGMIDDNIGYMSNSDDFITRRCGVVKRSIEAVTSEWIQKYFKSNVMNSLGREMPYKYYLFSKIVQNKKNDFLSNPNRYPVKEINTKEFNQVMLDALVKNYRNILTILLSRDYNYKYIVPYKSTTVMFTYSDFKDLFKMQAEFFINNPQYREDILNRVKEEAYRWKIDSDNYGIDIDCSYLLGKERPQNKSNVTIEVLNNFDTSQKMKSSNRSEEGIILDSNIKTKRKDNILSKFKKKNK